MVYLLWYLYIITAQVPNAGISDVVFYMSLIMHIILILLATGQIRVLLQNNHKHAGNSSFSKSAS